MDLVSATTAAMAAARKEKAGFDALVALALNLVPIAGALFWRWDVFTLIFLYWSENVVIGVRTLFSMLASAWAKSPVSLFGVIPLSLFFCVHYGMFCLVHGAFVVSMFGGHDTLGALDLAAATQAVNARGFNLIVGFASVLAWQGVQFALFLKRGEARRTSPDMLMASPYPRIIALHITILGGGFLVMALGQPVWGLLVLAQFKTAFDVLPRLPARGDAPPR
ncbi:MAG TPA: DUF6498-containing protein [Caulobacterales bacterium]|nr:DUF6498-containing protein [Caulobacterales bacterium]